MAAGASTHWLAWPQALVHVISYRMRRVSLWLPPLLYMVLIFQFSSESSPMPEVTEHVWDKLLHLAEYAGLAVLFCRALTGEGLGWLAAALTALLLASGYGATDDGEAPGKIFLECRYFHSVHLHKQLHTLGRPPIV